jgi:ABC-type ATPase involved in cell division
LLVDEFPKGLGEDDVARMLKLVREIHHAGATVVCATADEAPTRMAETPILHLASGRISVAEPL